MLQQAPKTHLWLVPEPLALVLWLLSIFFIFVVNLANPALSPIKSLSIWSMHSLAMSTSSALTGALRRLAIMVCIALNSMIFTSTCSVICETSSCHACIVFKYFASHARNFCNSPYNFLFSPIFIIHYSRERSFIAMVTISNYC